jgi:uncharacterized membrane protein (DUF4010 family)
MELVNARFGSIGAGLAAAVTGIFDVHASAASTLSLGASGALPPSSLTAPILVAFTTNTISKLVAAFTTGGVGYGIRVGSGLVAIALGIWMPLLWLR